MPFSTSSRRAPCRVRCFAVVIGRRRTVSFRSPAILGDPDRAGNVVQTLSLPVGGVEKPDATRATQPSSTCARPQKGLRNAKGGRVLQHFAIAESDFHTTPAGRPQKAKEA